MGLITHAAHFSQPNIHTQHPHLDERGDVIDAAHELAPVALQEHLPVLQGLMGAAGHAV